MAAGNGLELCLEAVVLILLDTQHLTILLTNNTAIHCQATASSD
jgi:hypothetical protein